MGDTGIEGELHQLRQIERALRARQVLQIRQAQQIQPRRLMEPQAPIQPTMVEELHEPDPHMVRNNQVARRYMNAAIVNSLFFPMFEGINSLLIPYGSRWNSLRFFEFVGTPVSSFFLILASMRRVAANNQPSDSLAVLRRNIARAYIAYTLFANAAFLLLVSIVPPSSMLSYMLNEQLQNALIFSGLNLDIFFAMFNRRQVTRDNRDENSGDVALPYEANVFIASWANTLGDFMRPLFNIFPRAERSSPSPVEAGYAIADVMAVSRAGLIMWHDYQGVGIRATLRENPRRLLDYAPLVCNTVGYCLPIAQPVNHLLRACGLFGMVANSGQPSTAEVREDVELLTRRRPRVEEVQEDVDLPLPMARRMG